MLVGILEIVLPECPSVKNHNGAIQSEPPPNETSVSRSVAWWMTECGATLYAVHKTNTSDKETIIARHTDKTPVLELGTEGVILENQQ